MAVLKPARLAMKKRSVTIHGHRTSLALEPEFWDVLDQAAKARDISLAALLTQIDDTRQDDGLPSRGFASHLRVWALQAVQS